LSARNGNAALKTFGNNGCISNWSLSCFWSQEILNLLQQAGFSKILRFYTGLLGRWIATRARLPSTFKGIFVERVDFTNKLNLKEMMFMCQQVESDGSRKCKLFTAIMIAPTSAERTGDAQSYPTYY